MVKREEMRLRLRASAFRLGLSIGLMMTTGLWLVMRALDLQSDGVLPAWARGLGGAILVVGGAVMWWMFHRDERRASRGGG